MDLLLTIFLLLSFAAWLWLLRVLKPNRKSANFPPGPNPLPIIGNILELGEKPHQSLAKLTKIYGPLMRLKLGTMTTVVVSSPEIARIVLQKYGQVFSSRHRVDAIRALDHHKHSVVWLPVDNHWRKLRKLCKENMFSVQRLDRSQGLRREKLRSLRDYVKECSVNGDAVNIGRVAFTTSLNLMSATLFSMEFAALGSAGSSEEFREIVLGIMTLIGKPNLADYLPLLRLTTDSSTPKNDMLEALLQINQKNQSEFSFYDIKHLLLDLFVAGTDTTSSTVEWAMTELLRNPEKMSKARNELRNVVGQNEEIQESDITRLPYLRAVVKETFRLHPAAPLLVPHKAEEDVEINGYIVPRNAQVLVNVWAMGRDSSVWAKHDVFMPERFLETETDVHGQHFELLPFGGGRRICVGLPLAYRMVHLMLATLISSFDWKLEEGLKAEEVDMDERFGLTLQKAIPLKAVPTQLAKPSSRNRQHARARPETPPISRQALQILWALDASQAGKHDNRRGILPEMAKIVLQKYDQLFSSRTQVDAARVLDHHKHSVAWLPVDNQWRKLRKLCKENMFSVHRLDGSQDLRREKLRNLRDYVKDCCGNGEAVNIGRAAFTTSLNLMTVTLFSKEFASLGSADSSQEFRDIVCGIMSLTCKPNLADYFPLLRLVDPHRIFRETTVYFKKCFAIFDEIIRQRQQTTDSSTPKNDMLEALLQINQKNESEFSLNDIKHLLLDLFVAGTDTTSSTVEWAMTELLRNPEKMWKARNELRNVAGQKEEIQESDISRLPYLRAVVKETFRLHPAAPLLVPHKAVEDVEVNGYIVPKNAQILVNVWAMGRDSGVWAKPDVFMPERFLETETDVHGQHFELLPFGGGRRICVGLPLAYRMVHLMLATLISSFDWKLEEGLKPEEVDMDERFGLTLQKAVPLKAVPTQL
ncbi:UNVERIFIED_CONTAM: cytochrome [Sesamum calycinum]|uniref:Cytochrome n=1 Tax=Sesamum calycinum TaxID=2727403 RepID=A0AAW2SZU1_9LAMI